MIIDIVLLFNFLLRVVWVTNWMPRPAPGSNLWLRITFCETNAMFSNYRVNQCQYLSLLIQPNWFSRIWPRSIFFAKVVSDEFRFHRFTGTWQQKPFQLLFHFCIKCSNKIIANIFRPLFFCRTRQKVEEYKYNIKPESKWKRERLSSKQDKTYICIQLKDTLPEKMTTNISNILHLWINVSLEKKLFELKEMQWYIDYTNSEKLNVSVWFLLPVLVSETMESILVKGRVWNNRTFTQKMGLKAKKIDS